MAMGVTTWPMVELEADDALASAAHLAARDTRVEKVCIWTPDKDLAQCVSGDSRRAGRSPQRRDSRRRACPRRNSGSPRRSSPTISRSSATRRTVIRASRASARKQPRASSRSTATSNSFPRASSARTASARCSSRHLATLAHRCAALRRCRRDALEGPDAGIRICGRETWQPASGRESEPASSCRLILVLHEAADTASSSPACCSPPSTHAQTPAETNTAGVALHALFDREWEWELTQDPLWASYLGDRRWNDRWEDISAERARRAPGAPGIGAERSRGDPARSALARRPPQLRPVPPSVSDGGRRLSASAAPDSHLDARAACRARSSSSIRCAFRPSRTSTTGSRGSTRFPRYMDQNIALMREGMKTNVLLPKIIAERVRPQIAQLATQAPEESGYYRPFRTHPELAARRRSRASGEGGRRARPLARAARVREAARVHGSRVPARRPTTASAGGARAAGSRAIATSRSTTRRPISRRRTFTRSA